MFVSSPGGKRKHTAVFEIRSKSTTAAGRRKELSKFRAELGRLAKKYRGKVKHKK